MLDDRKDFMNNEWVDWRDANVHMMSHGFSRGSTIFEVISFHENSGGIIVFRLEDHITRFFRSAELLEMEVPMAHADLCEAVEVPWRKSHGCFDISNGFLRSPDAN